MKYKISVLTGTMRPGYIDVIARALQEQAFKKSEFEWVLTDELYSHRRNAVEIYMEAHHPKINFKHVPPREYKDYFSASSTWNAAVLHAEGELLFFCSDHEYPGKRCLERHWFIHSKYKQAMISGPLMRVQYPSVDLKKIDLYKPDPSLYVSVLTKPIEGFVPPTQFVDLRGRMKGVKMGDQIFASTPFFVTDWWAGRNDSLDLKTLIDLNGFEELYDGAWGGNDTQFAARARMVGVKVLYDGISKCYEFPYYGKKKELMTPQKRDKMVLDKIGYPEEGRCIISWNDWILKEERMKLGYENP